MRVGSVCSGIGGAELAFCDLGHLAWASEIDPFARAILKHRFPELHLYGDFTKIYHPDPVDVLVGGTPCQAFSIAGLRGGMADERGNLALEYLRLAGRIRPRWLLWENVPGVLSSNGGRDFAAFVGGLAELGYGWAYRCLDAQYFGLAQRRNRVFVVGCLGDWRGAAAVLFEPASLRGHPAPRREAGEGTARPLASCPSGGSGYRNDADTADNLIAFNNTGQGWWNDADKASPIRDLSAGSGSGEATLVSAYGGNRQSGALEVATAVNAHGGPHGRLDFETETFVTHSLRADGFDASEDGTGRGTPLVADPGYNDIVTNPGTVRRLTPIECERLQGYPAGWTAIEWRGKPAADGPRYKVLGNAFPIPVIRWIARRLALTTP